MMDRRMVPRTLVRLALADVRPDRAEVLSRLGLGPDAAANARLDTLVGDAATLFERHAAPAALFEEIPVGDFAAIYAGEGQNGVSTPLDDISRRADALALFAATLGRDVDEAGRALFERGDPALGYVLDVTASVAAERLADLAARQFAAALPPRGRPAGQTAALAYSPGYCGWHVSGQHALFARLRPEPLGIALTPGALMDPVKSVSGVIVAGPGRIHRFRPTYAFCDACATHECLPRMASVARARGPRDD
jgi:hypothetical protein